VEELKEAPQKQRDEKKTACFTVPLDVVLHELPRRSKAREGAV